MFSLFFTLLSFSESLARKVKVSDQTKCLFLNDVPWIVRPTVIDLNPVNLKYYPFTISLNKCTRNCNVLSPNISVPRETYSI